MSLRIEKIAIGTAQFGLNYGISNLVGKTSYEEVEEILSWCLTNRILTIDTAQAYGDSEIVLGGFDLSKFHIVSKYNSTNHELSPNDALNISLHNLRINSIHGYLVHNSMSVISNPKLIGQLVELRQKGLVKKIGVSFYSPKELEQVLSIGFLPDLIQVPFNIIDTRFKEYFPELSRNGVEIHVRSAFLQGLLLMNSSQLSVYFDSVKSLLNDLAKEFISINTRAAFLVKFCLDEEHIDKVVIGVNNLSQLKNMIFSLENSEFSNIYLGEYNIQDNILMPNKWPTNDK
jgi:aryl-alcohol dehydrogenase-like predicted oxidoreductase